MGEVADNDSPISSHLATANVNTLASREVQVAQAAGQGLLVAGKIQKLEHEFFTAGYDFIGVQESRIRCDIDIKKTRYHF